MKNILKKLSVMAAFAGLVSSNLFADHHMDKDKRWTFGIAPGIMVPADKDFDDSAAFSIGGFAHYKLQKDRNLELEGHYSNLDVKADKLPGFGTQGSALDADSNWWTLGVNHLWWISENKEIHKKGWFVGAGIHWESWDLPASYISGNNDDTDGIAGKILAGYQFQSDWAARASYQFGGSGNAKAVGGGDFDRGAFLFNIEYHFK